MGNKVALHNLGCKVNAYEIEAMQQLLEEAGYEIVPFEPGADIYVINTCTVTNIADRKSRQMLHKAKKMNPEAIVVATGCYVQTGGEKLEKDEAIDLVLGNNQKINIVEALAEYAENKPGHGSHVIKINQTKEYEELSIDRTAEHVRAYIKVQDGCNQFCTYCIIPYARGRVRSRNIESVLKEVRALAEKGYKEVVLTGIHLSSYGVDFPEEKKETLLSLIRAVHEIEGIRRIRLGSLEPGIVTREFAEGIAALPKVCPHFHLSLQSGCDETLERMNRRYRSGEYRERCELLREVYGNPALTTGVIILYTVFYMPMNVLLYSGYLTNIPMALEEAACVDGASTWKTYWKIIFPIMKPMHATVAVLTALGTWNDVMTPLVIMSGSTGGTTLPLAQLNFQTQFGTNYNLAFASYLLALLPILLFYLICQKHILNGVVNGAVK